jgi:hypothetical protein
MKKGVFGARKSAFWVIYGFILLIGEKGEIEINRDVIL